MKIIHTLIITLIFAFTAAAQLTVNAPPNAIGPENNKVTIPFDVANANAITSFQFNVNFNPAILTPTGNPCAIGDLAAPMLVVCNSSDPGIVRMAAYGWSNFSGDGTIFNLTFYTHTGATMVKITNLYMFDQQGLVASSGVNGQITLQ